MYKLPVLLFCILGLSLTPIAIAADFEPPIDTRERFTYFYQRAQEGSIESTYEAAVAYLLGNGVERDTREGLKLMTIAAANLYPEALAYMQSAYEGGIVDDYIMAMAIEADKDKAMRYEQMTLEAIKQATIQDDPEPRYLLAMGLAYERERYGIEEDLVLAKTYYDRYVIRLEEMAEGNDPLAMVQLSNIYGRGLALRITNKELQNQWANAAAETGHPAGTTTLARLQEEDDPEAYEQNLTIAATAGYLPAIKALASLYGDTLYNDDGDRVREATSLKWQLIAYEQQADSLYAGIIGKLYTKLGNSEEGLQWHLKSLYNGNGFAISGKLYTVFDAILDHYQVRDDTLGTEERTKARDSAYSSSEYSAMYYRARDISGMCDHVTGYSKEGYCRAKSFFESTKAPM